MVKINCKSCNKEYEETTCNCCWISCNCGKKICGSCGSSNIREMEEHELSGGDDDGYWCCLICDDCGLEGCGMCV